MSWDSSPLSTANVDQGSDNPSLARVDIEALFGAVNTIRAARGVALGIAALDSDGKLTATQYEGEDILAVLADVQGASSGLDADLLDGLDSADFVLANGRTVIAFDPAGQNVEGNPMLSGVEIRAESAETSTTMKALSLVHESSGTPAAGFGVDLDLVLRTASGTKRTAGGFRATWIDPALATSTARLGLYARVANVYTEQLAVESSHVELFNVTPSGSPPSGRVWIYSNGGALFYKTSAGTVVGPLVSSGAGTSHSSLTDLDVPGDHMWAFLVDGTRAMTGDLKLGAHSLHAVELAANPSTPSTGEWKLYFKSNGLNVIDDAGTVTLVGSGAGVTIHNDLFGRDSLTAHEQYLLQQPNTNVVLNDAGADRDWRLEVVGIPNFFCIDAGQGVLAIGDNVTLPLSNTVGRFHVQTTTLPAAYLRSTGNTALIVDQNGTDSPGIAVTTRNNIGISISRTNAIDPTTNFLLSVGDIDNAFDALTALISGTTAAGSIALRVRVGTDRFFEVQHNRVVVNAAAGASADFAVLGDMLADPLLFCDVSAEIVQIGTTVNSARLNVDGGTLNGIAGSATASGKAGVVGTTTTGAAGLSGATSGVGVGVLGTTSGSGAAGLFTRAVAGASPVLDVLNSAGADAEPVIRANQFGTGALLELQVSTTTAWRWNATGEAVSRELGSTPPTPGTGSWAAYFKSGGFYILDDVGTETLVGGTGGVTPGGSTGDVQFNNEGAFDGDSQFTWNSSTDVLTIGGDGTLEFGSTIAEKIDFLGDGLFGIGIQNTNSLVTWSLATFAWRDAYAGTLLMSLNLSNDSALRLGSDYFIDIDQINTPSNPNSGRRRLYAKTGGIYMLDSSGVETALGGSGAPGGSDTQVQFNDGGVFGGDANFTWDKATNTLGALQAIKFNTAFFGTDRIYLSDNQQYGIGVEDGLVTTWTVSAFRWRLGGTGVGAGTAIMELISADKSLTLGADYFITLDERTAGPTAPAAGRWALYFKSDGAYIMDDLGTETHIGVAGSAAGSDTQVIFNDSGAYAGDTGLTFTKATDKLKVGGLIAFPNSFPATRLDFLDNGQFIMGVATSDGLAFGSFSSFCWRYGAGDLDSGTLAMALNRTGHSGALELGNDYWIDMDERGGAPTTPATGHWGIYFKSTSLWFIEDTGTEYQLLATTGSNDLSHGGDLAIGTTSAPNAAAVLDLVSTTKALVVPRMDSTQEGAISSPPNGSIIYNTTTDKFRGRAAGAWVDLH